MDLTTRAGTPTAMLSEGMGLVTTAPAPITQWSPMLAASRTLTPAEIQQLAPMISSPLVCVPLCSENFFVVSV